MHGPGLPPQHGHQPSTGGVVALRVLFALLPVLTCGFLAWGTMLRLALVTRKTVDWVLLPVSGALSVGCLILIGMDPTEDTSGWQGNLGAGGSLFTGFAICVYFLVADIKHHENKSAARAAYWYPQQAAPYAHPQPQPRPQPPVQRPAQSYGYPPAQQQPPAQPPLPPQQATPPPRLGQVRAELDELSELLRNQPPRDQDPNR
ncbi:hypothetical protein OG264_16285 [Streptomyces xanthophaeus]|uniref:hypothetical protein n=1 Tax=Streptomyces xanthophaeus TaxID=67385 RepID=UPI00386D754F|nr:hypothetical protein OG264_16285 [Streptomyces xanthophaeus]WST62109.1 hypothetical protein OG605_22150 [Streptomyces xanthophaeus]